MENIFELMRKHLETLKEKQFKNELLLHKQYQKIKSRHNFSILSENANDQKTDATAGREQDAL